MPFVIPPPIIKPYCNSGAMTPPPEAVSTSVANQETGWPALQATPLNAGGLPVQIQQFNGILNFYTQQILAMGMGATYTFDADVSDEQGGYPVGVILYCASNNSWQRSLVANNTFNFVANPSYVDDGVHWVSSETMYSLTVKAGGIAVQGNGGITATGGIRDANRSGIFFYNAAGSFKTAFYANTGITSDQGYALPIDYPTGVYTGTGIISGQSLQSDGSGNMGWNWPKGNPAGVAPAAGFIGYQPTKGYVNNAIVTHSLPGVYTNVTSTVLDVNGTYYVYLVGQFAVGTQVSETFMGISIDSSTGFSDAVEGDNLVLFNVGTPNIIPHFSQSISAYQISVTSAPKTVYAKCCFASDSANTECSMRISAILMG